VVQVASLVSFNVGAAGGTASASSTATSRGSGGASSSATANGGMGGRAGFPGGGTAVASASAAGGGTALADAVATGGAADAMSNAKTAKGALAEAQSIGSGESSGQAQSTAKTSLAGVSVQSNAVAQESSPTGGTATTNAIAQAGGSGQSVPNTFDTADAFSTALPDKAYATALIDGATNVADALLGPRDEVFGTAILGSFDDDSAESTFDFRFRGDLLVGLIDGSAQFSIEANGVEILSESFADDTVINLGSNLGPNIDLTLSVANGSGVFAVGVDTVPEPSTWAMILIGFAGFAFAGFRRAKARPPQLLGR
jgi:PEP-CTERM motif